jgi:hypothetical protein
VHAYIDCTALGTLWLWELWVHLALRRQDFIERLASYRLPANVTMTASGASLLPLDRASLQAIEKPDALLHSCSLRGGGAGNKRKSDPGDYLEPFCLN